MNISHLVHFDRPNNLHGVDPEMIKVQAELAGIPLVQRKVDSGDFEKHFKNAIAELVGQGTKGMVFGDIFLEPHKEWVDRVCRDLGIDPIEPLWGMKTETIIEEFVNNGFETIVASGSHELIEKKYIGRPMDREFIEYLKFRKLDVCGECGEFHTFVTRGPLFHGRIEITDAEVTDRDGFWFLNVHAFSVVMDEKKQIELDKSGPQVPESRRDKGRKGTGRVR